MGLIFFKCKILFLVKKIEKNEKGEKLGFWLGCYSLNGFEKPFGLVVVVMLKMRVAH